ncbi:MAG: extracellular solute-binding protein [Candidatus Atribacteria bacterium]|nr:extracellular solute-binding protein [Candidatus Atribacteria bacterium]
MKKALFVTLVLLLLFTLSSFVFAAGKTWESQKGEYAGKSITVLVTDPHTMVVQAWKPSWEELTGGKVDIVVVPYASLYDKMMTDFITDTGAYDLICWPSSWSGDIMGGGWVLSLKPFMDDYGYPNWDDVVPAQKNNLMWAGVVYALPYDGDCHLIYYRKDALENKEYQAKFKAKYGYDYNLPPKTWEEVIDVAEFFNNWDWNNDGKNEYGIDFIAQRKTQAQWTLLDIVMQYAAQPGVAPYFNPDTMEPLVNNPGWVEAVTVITKLAKLAPPGILGYGYSENRQAFVSGNAAMSIDWGDIGVMEQSEKEYGSKVKGKLGYGPLPGAKKTFNFKDNKWIEGYNQVNFLDFGGWIYSISKFSKNPEMAYKFGTFMTTPEHSLLDVDGAHGYTGANPWRFSQYKEIAKWVTDGGWGEESAKGYLGAIEKIMSDAKAMSDLRIPGGAEYYDYMDLHLADALAGKATPQDVCDAVYKEWQKITDSYGRDKQLKLYRESLGLPAK